MLRTEEMIENGIRRLRGRTRLRMPYLFVRGMRWNVSASEFWIGGVFFMYCITRLFLEIMRGGGTNIASII